MMVMGIRYFYLPLVEIESLAPSILNEREETRPWLAYMRFHQKKGLILFSPRFYFLIELPSQTLLWEKEQESWTYPIS